MDCNWCCITTNNQTNLRYYEKNNIDYIVNTYNINIQSK